MSTPTSTHAAKLSIPHLSAPNPHATLPNTRKPNLLLLTHRLPYPPDRGDRIRSYNLLKHLSKHFQVSLASYTEEPPTPDQENNLRKLTRRLAICPLTKSQKYARAARSLLTKSPITTSVFYDPKLAQQIIHWHTEVRFDAVITFCSGMVQHARDIVGTKGKVGNLEIAHAPHASRGAGHTFQHPTPIHLLDLVDVDSIKWANFARQSSLIKRCIYKRESKLLRQIELGQHDNIDALTVVSPAELETYQQLKQNHIATSPTHNSITATHMSGFHSKGLRAFSVTNGVDLDFFKPTPDPGPNNFNIAFTGVLDYKPNIDAVIWFATQVMPTLRSRIPQASFTVIGKRPTQAVLDLHEYQNTQVLGEVPDIRPHLQSAAVIVAPLKIAPGVQNKILEAMATQRTVVCTPAAAKGIDAMIGRDLHTAKTAMEYVDLIQRLLTYPEERIAISKSARHCVEQTYDWSAVLTPLTHFLLRNLRTNSVKPIHLPKSSRPLTQPTTSSQNSNTLAA
ncbi:glycosyltransferase [Planctomycetota bacterium]|nr:glycosyltransferase [Planctomycetota bacterium]